MRRQAVYALLADQAPQPLFRELFISIADLQKQVLPNFNILANRWLFQYLTETLDKRMLALLMRNDDPAIACLQPLNGLQYELPAVPPGYPSWHRLVLLSENCPNLPVSL